ncbi:T9SS type A sorting domain-containing protein [Lishizhenia sp.]|uniref:T9SS type A sorting domain-containing protein n=1 Tax=Lishizhenia sp. TaxID=2497594 RepID=UPI00299DB61F|nr:T9SS type A sorting domain-containing protein [Lishizhenia sp.]MDX1444643.1 T9SS type A sorting domain-containing protein [Lishizhenia sp.]
MKHAITLLILFPLYLVAQPYLGQEPEIEVLEMKAATCVPANTSTYLELNNVSALVHTAGNLWQVNGQNFSHYEVPKNSGIMALFASALWLGGKDVNGQLKLAALRYRNGNDYWTGPLTIGNATTDSDVCEEYDKHFISSQDEVREFRAWYNAGLNDQANGTNTQNTLYPNYEVPKFIKEWPAHGDVEAGQDYYLAPFYDRNEDGNYDWQDGDYPWYDLDKSIDCRTDRTVTIFGDQNFWWVMNDKGNIHTESGGDPIGMEIRAQAFSFSTNDEVNNMTFYNYELINRSTQTLYDTYFGLMIDVALGGPFDDYVGCDVSRGLGYAYNGNAFDPDVSGFLGYGDAPPAIGVDFFEGPYQDNDGIDNAFGIGPNEALNGIGYGDSIIDNERFGMRRFLYYNNLGGGADVNTTDPQTAIDYYNYLSGYWKDGTRFTYGGNGHSSGGGNPNVEADFMFPGDTDPLGWGTGGNPQPEWTEQTAGNPPYDRRFAQSAGPFVLKPGAVNNITMGVVWARSGQADPFASVVSLQKADDKAQALFENCFKVIEGPHAPDMSVQELENELAFTLENPTNSNNFNEGYREVDPFIAGADSLDKVYRFQGYQVYQLSGKDVSVSDLGDIDKARLVFQCDIKDSVSRLVNFEFDNDLLAAVPTEKVVGADEGIRHSFSVKEDMFAAGASKSLVNFKRYYYMAIAYAYNNYKTYTPNDASALDGQQKPYIASRKSAIGEVRVVEGIPHLPTPEAGGTIANVGYGFELPITRIDGMGNGGRVLDLSAETKTEILKKNKVDKITYASNGGPVAVKVVDPLNIKEGDFVMYFHEDENGDLDQSNWTIIETNSGDSISSNKSIDVYNEQLLPEWGLSVSLEQTAYVFATAQVKYTAPLEATLTFKDSSKNWLIGLQDNDSYSPNNWIRSGTYAPTAADCNPNAGINNPCNYADAIGIDPEKTYTNLLDGIVAPFGLVGSEAEGMPIGDVGNYSISGALASTQVGRTKSVDIIFTDDKSLWTKCPVIETGRDQGLNQNQGQPFALRNSPSLDENGNEIAGSTGFSYFPGYAIEIETGKRLNMAFGENSFLAGENGNDMLWNPTSTTYTNLGVPKLGGMHPVFVFSADMYNNGASYYTGDMSAFEENMNYSNTSGSKVTNFYRSIMWVMYPLLNEGHTLLESEATMRLRVNRKYEEYTATGDNNSLPLYGFSTRNFITEVNNTTALANVLDQINVVPNPYYAFSKYEADKLDKRVKFTNLPERCNIRIYNTSGRLVRSIRKDNPLTFTDWNLTNAAGIPVSSGTYIVHIEVPDVGETVLKAFITMRQPDLENI